MDYTPFCDPMQGFELIIIIEKLTGIKLPV